MNVKGIVWLGTRTPHFAQMVAFCKDGLGMEQTRSEEGFAIYDMPNGDRMEIFSDNSPYNTFFTNPVAGFLVDDVAAARAELEAREVEFLGPIEYGDNGYAWSHFRAPDGFIYELSANPLHPVQRH